MYSVVNLTANCLLCAASMFTFDEFILFSIYLNIIDGDILEIGTHCDLFMILS